MYIQVFQPGGIAMPTIRFCTSQPFAAARMHDRLGNAVPVV